MHADKEPRCSIVGAIPSAPTDLQPFDKNLEMS
jgi:hypothetical protein